jgi:hypothetical protein
MIQGTVGATDGSILKGAQREIRSVETNAPYRQDENQSPVGCVHPPDCCMLARAPELDEP